MTWFKVCDTLHSHPKTEKAGAAAMGLWVIAGSWSADQLTDGLVTEERCVRLIGDRKEAHRLAKSLVAAGFWVEVEGGYRYHDWHELQPTAESVKAEKARKRRNVADHRARRSQEVTAPVTGYSTGKSPVLFRGPDPDPDPDPIEKEISEPAAPASEPALAIEVPKRPTRVRKPKTEPEPPHPRHGEVVDAYFAAFEARRGSKPLFGSRDGLAVKLLLAQCAGDADRAISVIRGAFTGDPWLADKATIASIAADPSKYLGKPKPGSGLQRNLQQFIPANGTYDGGGFVDT